MSSGYSMGIVRDSRCFTLPVSFGQQVISAGKDVVYQVHKWLVPMRGMVESRTRRETLLLRGSLF